MTDFGKAVTEVRQGEALPVQERTVSSTNLVMYAGATWDWHRLHHDQAFAEDMGLHAPVIDGQIYGALFAKQVVSWLGAKWFIQKQSFRMRAMAFAGDSLQTEGTVAEVRGDGVVIISQRILKGDVVIAEATTEASRLS